MKRLYLRGCGKMSEYNSEVVSVIFRTWKHGTFKGSVDALFPYMPHSGLDHSITAFGEHGHASADYHYVLDRTRLSTPEEYKDLKLRLEEIGYDLKVIKRINYDKFLQAFEDVK